MTDELIPAPPRAEALAPQLCAVNICVDEGGGADVFNRGDSYLKFVALGDDVAIEVREVEGDKLRGEYRARDIQTIRFERAEALAPPEPREKPQRWQIACPIWHQADRPIVCSWCNGTGFVAIYLAKDIEALPAPPRADARVRRPVASNGRDEDATAD